MQPLYTSALSYKADMLVRGYDENGVRFTKIEPIKPYLFIASQDPDSPYKTVHGEPAERIDFTNTYEARDYINRYKDVSKFPLYGMHQWVYPYIHDTYVQEDGNIPWSRESIRAALIDIETDTGMYDDHMKVKVRKTERHEEIETTVEQLFKWVEYEVFDIGRDGWVPVKISSYITGIDYGDVLDANKEINAITIYDSKARHYYVFGMYPWTPKDKDITYYCADNEREMLRKFAEILSEVDPDVVSGWNSEGYDIPYITNRFYNIFGDRAGQMLSPWGLVDTRTFTNDKGREEMHAQWLGINGIDYMDLYKKFEDATEESYKLDFISTKVLGEGKIDYESEYGSLRALYILNRELYYEYNMIDVRRLAQMEDKLRLFDVMISLAYYMKVNFSDVFGTVRPWDAYIHSYLMRQGIVVPYLRPGEEGDSIAGGFVKQPAPRKFKWPVSFDVKSLYPSLARQCNISPETIITTIPGINPDVIMRKAIDKAILAQIKAEGVSLCGTGCVFDNSVEGFIAACMRITYEERVYFQSEKKKANKALKEVQAKLKAAKGSEKTALTAEATRLSDLVGYYDAQQKSRKLAINSLYGSLANRFNRWFDNRLAESITLTGQTTIQFVAMYINKFLNLYCGTKDVDYIIYIDTDSNYIELGAVVDKNGWNELTNPEIAVKLDDFCNNDLKPIIDKAFADLFKYLNHRTPVLDMARENIGSAGVWSTAKKRYAMAVYDSEGDKYDPPKLKIQGHEAAKNSTPRAARSILKEAIYKLLMLEQKDFQAYILDEESVFKTKPFEEVAENKAVNSVGKWEVKQESGPSTYKKGTPINSRAAIVYNNTLTMTGTDRKYQKIQEGDKVKIVYLQQPNPVHSNVIAAPYNLPPEFDLHDYIDHRAMFNKFVVKPLTPFAEAAGWTVYEVMSLDDLCEY